MSRPWPRWRNLGSRLLLALALLASQHAAGLHEISHGVAEFSRSKDSSDPVEPVCEKCLAFASLGHAMSSVAVLQGAPLLTFAHHEAVVPADLASPPRLAYRSRAPPSLS